MTERKENNDFIFYLENNRNNYRCIDGYCRPNERDLLRYPQQQLNFNRFDVFAVSAWNEHYGVIYILIDTNKDNSLHHKMLYIGQTIQPLKDRFYDHLTDPSSRFLKEAIERYSKVLLSPVVEIDKAHYRTKGGEFTIKVIDYCIDLDDINKKEKYYIKKYKSCYLDYYYIKDGRAIPLYGYNVNRGGGGFVPLRGELHPLYKHVKKNLLKDLIRKGYFVEEIARELDLDPKTVHRKIKELWGEQGINNLTRARLAFGGMADFKERLKKRFKESGVKTFQEGVLHPYYVHVEKKDVKNYIKNGLSAAEISNKMGISLRTFYKKLQDFWDINYPQARRVFRIYPKILKIIPELDNNFLEDLINDGLSYEEIDIEFLKKLISLDYCYSRVQLANMYEKSDRAMGDYIFNTLKMNYLKARDEFWWKPRIISLIKEGYTLTQLRPVGLSRFGKHITHEVIVRIWNKEYKEHEESIIKLFNYLKQIYLS